MQKPQTAGLIRGLAASRRANSAAVSAVGHHGIIAAVSPVVAGTEAGAADRVQHRSTSGGAVGVIDGTNLTRRFPARVREKQGGCMQAVLGNGKEVRGVNSGRGLQGAAYDFNSGELGSRDNPNHLHVYLGSFPEGHEFEFICSQAALTADELPEAAAALAEAKQANADEMLRLRASILGPDGEALLQERQGQIRETDTAPRDIARAILGIPPHTNAGSWAEVKAEVHKLRLAGA